MALTGIDKITYGVEDMERCARFFTDWGLTRAETGPDHVLFRTVDGCEVELRPADAPDLPPAIEGGSTVRRVVWGTRDAAALAMLTDGMADGPEGPEIRDPNGVTLSFRVTRRSTLDLAAPAMNGAGQPARVDARAPIYDHAEPLKIGHVVFFCPNVTETVAFYRDRLGFVVSDYYPDEGYFLRCKVEGGHHDLFLLKTPDGKRGLNHVSFTVRDIHEVFGGGLAIDRKGWTTQIGPGRHPISSAYFWYVACPAGALAEYYADEDYCTESWEAKAWDRLPENYAEWAVAGGIDGKTRRPKARA